MKNLGTFQQILPISQIPAMCSEILLSSEMFLSDAVSGQAVANSPVFTLLE